MRMIFASLARAKDRVHIHKVRDFPQAELDSKMNARFLLNKHCKVPFLLH